MNCKGKRHKQGTDTTGGMQCYTRLKLLCMHSTTICVCEKIKSVNFIQNIQKTTTGEKLVLVEIASLCVPFICKYLQINKVDGTFSPRADCTCDTSASIARQQLSSFN